MLVGILALVALASVEEPRIMNDFRLRGSDGKVYTLNTLTAGKPTVVFYLNSKFRQLKVKSKDPAEDGYEPYGFERPTGIADVNRLSAMTKGKLRVFALTFGSPKEVAAQAKRGGLKVVLLGREERGSEMDLVNQMLAGSDKRDLSHLQNMLIVPNPGREARIWKGYSRTTLADMQRLVGKWTGVKLRLDLSRFPAKLQQGGTMMFGLPH